MTNIRDNEIFTQVGPGTPMGELMRQYWIPAAMSSELKADGDPMRLVLLGEKLIGFRDSAGRAGIMEHRCPHRGASFFFGRNEENGIRCVYHGWKFDVEGNCVDQANLPPNMDFRQKVKARAYKVAERNGVVFVYMGKRQEAPPPLPAVESTLVPEDQLSIRFTQREANWLQGLEGELDTSHVGIMHFGKVDRSAFQQDALQQFVVANRAPEYQIQETNYGYIYAAHRPADEGQTYWRFGHLLFPFWTMPPINSLQTNVLTRAYVPMDDTHTMIVELIKQGAYAERRPVRGGEIVGGSRNYPYLPNTTDWYGRWRLKLNASNDYGIDREVQRTESYTGIEGIQMQDQAIQESMGAILDRTLEHLAPSDIMITQVRRLLIRTALAYDKDKTLPPSVDHPEYYDRVRGGHFVAKKESHWLEVYRDLLAASPWEGVGVEAGK